MHVGQTFQLYIIGGLIICYVVSAVASGYAARAQEALPPDARERVFQRLARWSPFLYGLDALGVCGLILGMARVWGLLRGAFPYVWGFRLIVLGVAIFCLERTLHAWSEWSAQCDEPDAASSRRRALLSAAAVTLVQGVLAVTLCVWVFGNIRQAGQGYVAADGVIERPQAEDTPPPRGREIHWVNEARALEILGKDKAYLDLLIPWAKPWAGTRAKTIEGRTFYCAEDLVKLRDAGLPSVEELKSALRPEEETKGASNPLVAPAPRTEPVPAPPPKRDDTEVLKE
jgi:hypothetical protein